MKMVNITPVQQTGAPSVIAFRADQGAFMRIPFHVLPDTGKLQTGAISWPNRASEVLIIWEGDSGSDGLIQCTNITQRQMAILCSIKRLLLTRHENIRHPTPLRILLLGSSQRANTSGRIVVMLSKALDPEV